MCRTPSSNATGPHRGVLAAAILGVLLVGGMSAAATPPASWDWRDLAGHSYVTPVRSQGACGSSVYFGCVAMMEAAILIADKTPDIDLDLSEQYVMACGRTLPAMYECGGAAPYYALWFLRDTGAPAESVFPYQATSGLPCPAVPAEQLTRIHGLAERSNVLPDTIRALAAIRPVLAGVYAGNEFSQYSEGIFRANTPPASPDDMNHVLLVVGWGSEAGTDYWICKNSWGTWWGEDGYIRIAVVRNLCNFGRHLWTLSYHSPTGLAAELPRAQVLSVAPNPFNPLTVIAFDLDQPMEVRVEMFDLSGRAVRLLRAAPLGAGRHEVVWDGRDDRGRVLPTGVYCVRLVAGERREMRKVALIR